MKPVGLSTVSVGLPTNYYGVFFQRSLISTPHVSLPHAAASCLHTGHVPLSPPASPGAGADWGHCQHLLPHTREAGQALHAIRCHGDVCDDHRVHGWDQRGCGQGGRPSDPFRGPGEWSMLTDPCNRVSSRLCLAADITLDRCRCSILVDSFWDIRSAKSWDCLTRLLAPTLLR